MRGPPLRVLPFDCQSKDSIGHTAGIPTGSGCRDGPRQRPDCPGPRRRGRVRADLTHAGRPADREPHPGPLGPDRPAGPGAGPGLGRGRRTDQAGTGHGDPAGDHEPGPGPGAALRVRRVGRPLRPGLSDAEVGAINDDRVARALDALFDADRASLLTSVMLRAIKEFSVDTSQLHNDSTSISVHGAYHDADGTARAGKATPVITHGHSKDHRPDLKQLVWILTVSADGAVPIAYRLADGNTVDDPTHIPTWHGLVALLGRVDFLYVADSKLCSRQAMGHIAGRGGRFVTVMPRSRREDKAFRD